MAANTALVSLRDDMNAVFVMFGSWLRCYLAQSKNRDAGLTPAALPLPPLSSSAGNDITQLTEIM